MAKVTKKKKLGIGLLIFGVMFLAIFIWAMNSGWVWVDSCLDMGGCWDQIDHICRRDESNAQALCDRSKSLPSASSH